MRTNINKRTTPSFIASAALIAAMPLLASCVSSGFYYMSDDWCSRHLEAGRARCPENQDGRISNGDPGIDTERSGFASR
jgi:hypothetical protein